MKVYIAYIDMSEEEYQEALLFGMLTKEFRVDVIGDNHRVTYGFTNDKDIFDHFMFIHIGLSSKKVKMEKSEYEKLSSTYKVSRIDFEVFRYGMEKDVTLPTIWWEYYSSSEDCNEIFNEIICPYSRLSPNIFTKEIRSYLHREGYIFDYVVHSGDTSSWFGEYYDKYSESKAAEYEINEVGLLTLLFPTFLNFDSLLLYIQNSGGE